MVCLVTYFELFSTASYNSSTEYEYQLTSVSLSAVSDSIIIRAKLHSFTLREKRKDDCISNRYRQ